MIRALRFPILLPVTHTFLAARFGGFGLGQRFALLNRPFLEGQTLWDSTARFHVWPWPYKLAAVFNLSALLARSLTSLPLAHMRPGMTDSAANLPALLFVPFLWHWVGSGLDRRWRMADKTPWAAWSVFTAASVAGAVPIGSVGFLP